MSGQGQEVGHPVASYGQTHVLTLHLLSFVAEVWSNHGPLLDRLGSLFRSSLPIRRPGSGQVVARFSVWRSRGDESGEVFVVVGEDGRSRSFSTVEDAIVHLELLLVTAALLRLRSRLLVHAGVVARGPYGIMLPAASGGGKSTLVAALTFSGFTYLSDEVAVVDLSSGELLPLLKPIGLKEGGWRALSEQFRVPSPLMVGARVDGELVHYLVPPSPAAPYSRVVPRFIVVPCWAPGASASLEPVSRAQTVAEVSRHSLNLPSLGPRGLEVLARLVEGAQCFRMVYDRLSPATALLDQLLRTG